MQLSETSIQLFQEDGGDTHITKRQDYHNFTYNRVVFVGCYIEAYISPSILKKIFGIFT